MPEQSETEFKSIKFSTQEIEDLMASIICYRTDLEDGQYGVVDRDKRIERLNNLLDRLVFEL